MVKDESFVPLALLFYEISLISLTFVALSPDSLEPHTHTQNHELALVPK